MFFVFYEAVGWNDFTQTFWLYWAFSERVLVLRLTSKHRAVIPQSMNKIKYTQEVIMHCLCNFEYKKSMQVVNFDTKTDSLTNPNVRNLCFNLWVCVVLRSRWNSGTSFLLSFIYKDLSFIMYFLCTFIHITLYHRAMMYEAEFVLFFHAEQNLRKRIWTTDFDINEPQT